MNHSGQQTTGAFSKWQGQNALNNAMAQVPTAQNIDDGPGCSTAMQTNIGNAQAANNETMKQANWNKMGTKGRQIFFPSPTDNVVVNDSAQNNLNPLCNNQTGATTGDATLIGDELSNLLAGSTDASDIAAISANGSETVATDPGMKLPDIDADDDTDWLLNLDWQNDKSTNDKNLDELEPAVRKMLCSVPEVESQKCTKVFDDNHTVQPQVSAMNRCPIVKGKRYVPPHDAAKLTMTAGQRGSHETEHQKGGRLRCVPVHLVNPKNEKQSSSIRGKSVSGECTLQHIEDNIKVQRQMMLMAAQGNKRQHQEPQKDVSSTRTLRSLYSDPNFSNLYIFASLAELHPQIRTRGRLPVELRHLSKFENWFHPSHSNITLPAQHSGRSRRIQSDEKYTDCSVSEYLPILHNCHIRH